MNGAVDGVDPFSAPALVFVDDLAAPVIDADDRHHLERVRRLRAGTVVVASDGLGSWRPVRLGPDAEPCGEVVADPVRIPLITVAFTPVKGDRPEWVVQKLTELGVDRIIPLRADRSVVRWDDGRGGRQVDRWTRVAREAAMQCRRTRLPTLSGIVDALEVLAEPGTAAADVGGAPPDLTHPTVAIGPEGGWSPAELAVVDHRIALGDNVLRAETAALAAGTLLTALRAGLTTPTRTVR